MIIQNCNKYNTYFTDMYNPDKKSIIMYLMSYFHVLVDAKQLQPSEVKYV